MAGIRLGRRLRELFARAARDESFFEELEDALVEGDLGGRFAAALTDELREAATGGVASDRDAMVSLLEERLRERVRVRHIDLVGGELNVLLVVGVNGVGKTTTIAKLAHRFSAQGVRDIVLAAADTFRAAAVEQLEVWGERLGVRVIAQGTGADPGAVVYDSITSALSRGSELLIVDTAGRLHNKATLVKELEKLDKIIRSRCTDGILHKLLVIDATTGQNALRQAEAFNEAIGVDSCVLAKYDSSARGGIVVPICSQLGIPFSFVGTGEGLEDLRDFDAGTYVSGLVRGDGLG